MSISDDNHSVMSSVSISNTKIECPECKKELSTKYLFNHIRKYHPDYFLSMFKVWKDDDFKELINDCKALPVEWEYTNDFDESEFKNIWGCLGCNNTYTVENKAHAHCKSKKCKTDHKKGLQEYYNQEQKEKKQKLEKQSDSRFKYNNRTPDQIFNDTRIVINHAISSLTSDTLKNDFIKYMTKYDRRINYENIFSFNYCFDIKLTSDKSEMETQERYIWKLWSTIENTYKDSLATLYYNPHIISDDEHLRLTKLIQLHNNMPKFSYE